MEMGFVRALTLVVLSVILGWPTSAQGDPDDRGKVLYQAKCLLCHGEKGNGKGPGAIALNPKPADYTKSKFWEQPDIDKKIADIVKTGKGQMQAATDLTPEDIQAIITYMKNTFKPK